MLDELFEDLRYPFIGVAVIVCASILAMHPYALRDSSGAGPGAAAQSRSLSRTGPTPGMAIQGTVLRRNATQRRTWMVRLNLFEVRIERDSWHGSDRWAVTILTHESEKEADTTRGPALEKCI